MWLLGGRFKLHTKKDFQIEQCPALRNPENRDLTAGAFLPFICKGENMFLHVIGVTYLENYRLRLKFSDGVVKDIDLKNELYGEVFEPLKDIEFFKQVAVNSETNTIEWPNNADFAPEFLYEIGEETKRVVQAAAS
jgi:hypothetical protein